jgi:hypothetical protein
MLDASHSNKNGCSNCGLHAGRPPERRPFAGIIGRSGHTTTATAVRRASGRQPLLVERKRLAHLSGGRDLRRAKRQSGLPTGVRSQHESPPNLADMPCRFFDRETAIRNARRIDVAVGTLRNQLHTYPEWMNTHDSRINDAPNEVRPNPTPLQHGKVVDVLPPYHGSHSFSLPLANWLKINASSPTAVTPRRSPARYHLTGLQMCISLLPEGLTPGPDPYWWGLRQPSWPPCPMPQEWPQP